MHTEAEFIRYLGETQGNNLVVIPEECWELVNSVLARHPEVLAEVINELKTEDYNPVHFSVDDFDDDPTDDPHTGEPVSARFFEVPTLGSDVIPTEDVELYREIATRDLTPKELARPWERVRYTDAIRQLRADHRLGLKDSKDVIDQILAD